MEQESKWALKSWAVIGVLALIAVVSPFWVFQLEVALAGVGVVWFVGGFLWSWFRHRHDPPRKGPLPSDYYPSWTGYPNHTKPVFGDLQDRRR